jgi:L-alanine-DL-glutamate epimerase-like enolase superfamily enzyme
VPLLLIDLETKEGVTGRAWLFCCLRAVRKHIGENVSLMVDYNKALSLDDALERA